MHKRTELEFEGERHALGEPEPADAALCQTCHGSGLANGVQCDDAVELGLRLLNAVRVIAFQSGEKPERIVDWLTKESGLLKLFEAWHAAQTQPTPFDAGEMPSSLFIQIVPDTYHSRIRRWSSKPFAGGIEYHRVPAGGGNG